MALLEVRNLQVAYNEITALRGVDLEVQAGELVTLVGANGAGKTTLLKAISGLRRVAGGEVMFANVRLTGLEPHRIAARGIAHVPEGRRVFASLTVRENLQLGGYLLRRNEGKAKAAQQLDSICAYFPILGERQNDLVGNLSGGQQQLLVIGRALMMSPKLLLLDEPTMGLAPKLVEDVLSGIHGLKGNSKTAILLVEQMAFRALALADRGYVLHQGRILITGTGRDLLNDPRVQEAYLGAKG